MSSALAVQSLEKYPQFHLFFFVPLSQCMLNIQRRRNSNLNWYDVRRNRYETMTNSDVEPHMTDWCVGTLLRWQDQAVHSCAENLCVHHMRMHWREAMLQQTSLAYTAQTMTHVTVVPCWRLHLFVPRPRWRKGQCSNGWDERTRTYHVLVGINHIPFGKQSVQRGPQYTNITRRHQLLLPICPWLELLAYGT